MPPIRIPARRPPTVVANPLKGIGLPAVDIRLPSVSNPLDRLSSGFDRVRDAVLDLFGNGPYRSVRVDAPPAMNPDARFGKLSGTLFGSGPKLEQIEQGYIANCTLPAVSAGIVQRNPNFFRQIIRDNGDGTYTVTLRGGRTHVTTTADMPLEPATGKPLYGHDPTNESFWFALVEKAIAAHLGGYDKLQGTQPYAFMELLLGRGFDGKQDNATTDRDWSNLKRAHADGRVILTGSDGADVGEGLMSSHAYTVLGFETKNGEEYVTLRNPYGPLAVASGVLAEPAGNGSSTDGVFQITRAQWQNDFQYYLASNNRP